MTDESIATIARGLSARQKSVLLHGLQGSDTIATLRSLQSRRLMRVHAADPDPATSGWKPTPLGLAVREHLQQVPATPTLSTGDEM